MVKDSTSGIFAKINIDTYKGKWIAVCEMNIVSFGDNAKETFEEAQKKCPKKRIVIARVPDEQTMIY